MSRYYRRDEDGLHRLLLKHEPNNTNNISNLCLLRYRFARLSLRQWLMLVIIAASLSFVAFNQLVPTPLNSWIRIPPQSDYHCHQIDYKDAGILYATYRDSKSNSAKHGQLRSDSKILVFVETQYSKLGRDITLSLESIKFKFKMEIAGKSVPLLTSQDRGKYSVIVFENYFKYLRMNKWNRDLLDKYCREYGVGIVGFLQNVNTTRTRSMHLNLATLSFPMKITPHAQLRDYQLNPNTDFLRITRAGAVSLGTLPESNWFTFDVPENSTTYVSVAQALSNEDHVDFHPGSYRYSSLAKTKKSRLLNLTAGDYRKHLLTTVLQDNGSHDAIKKVIFGNGLQFWLHSLIFLDALTYLSNGRLTLPLQRYIQIDIDDIFVGERGTRLKVADVEALIAFQQKVCDTIPGFKFNLGFSGKYFHRGFSDENDGDDHIIKNADEFRWFSHTYSHSQAHLSNNATYIESELSLNQQFAECHGIPVDNVYIVSPHHSGVYPIHEPLYDAWRKVLNIQVTSTEEYPHLRPAHLRRAFVHKGIVVLPRQTCGLYTHTIYLDKYPGGKHKLETSVFGGELFASILTQQISVFMTHQSNYANDRLAIYTFDSLFKFIQCWTNLQLLYLPPLQLAKKYFQIYPEEKDPIWTNPCEDRRHYNIWSPDKSCYRLPKILILGPQKTGSTALSTFLSAHPSVRSNRPSNRTFEEVQFFNSKNYYKGLDWYMDFFSIPESVKLANETLVSVNNSRYALRIPPPFNESPLYFYDKSSNYFDGENVANRVHALLPHAKLVIILINPLKRAYSWYQHMRAHNHTAALNFSFYQVVSLDFQARKVDEKSMKQVRDLRNRCLLPGVYVNHLERWIAYFPIQQMSIIDGDELRNNPVAVMNRLQNFLKLEPHLNYRKLLRYEPKKGFYCLVAHDNTTKCLGKSKGRMYEDMDDRSRKYLHDYYLHYNVVLSKLLNRFRVAIPSWLQAELSTNE